MATYGMQGMPACVLLDLEASGYDSFDCLIICLIQVCIFLLVSQTGVEVSVSCCFPEYIAYVLPALVIDAVMPNFHFCQLLKLISLANFFLLPSMEV